MLRQLYPDYDWKGNWMLWQRFVTVTQQPEGSSSSTGWTIPAVTRKEKADELRHTSPPPPSPIKLASWQKVLAVFSIITQLFKKSNAFYGNRMLIPAFTQPTDPPLSQAPSFLFPSGFPTNIMHTFLISRACYMSRQSNPCYYWNVLNSCAN